MNRVTQSTPVARTLGRFRILDTIGAGGMAVVHRAVMEGEEGFGKVVALKRIRHDTASDAAVRLFAHEARIGALLSHPNVVQVVDFGRDGEEWYMAMEYVDGITLKDAMAGIDEPWPQKLAAYVALQVARGLAHAHSLRDMDGRPLALVHRDVNPRNVLLSVHGEVKLADFGIADFAGRERFTRTGEVRGKLAYLAPEQTTGKGVDFRTDIFALGLVLWEMVAGRPRYDISSSSIFTDVMVAQYMSPSVCGVRVDDALEAVLRRMMAPVPHHRWDSTEGLAGALESYLDGYDGSREIADLVRSVREGRGAGPIHLEMPTRLNHEGETIEFVHGMVLTGRTRILEENRHTRRMSKEEIRSVVSRTRPTEGIVFGAGRPFMRGVVAGAAVVLLLVGGWKVLRPRSQDRFLEPFSIPRLASITPPAPPEDVSRQDGPQSVRVPVQKDVRPVPRARRMSRKKVPATRENALWIAPTLPELKPFDYPPPAVRQ